MKRLLLVTGVCLGVLLLPTLLLAQADFATSLHGTRQGKATWYSADNGGFEALTGVPMDSLPCLNCHATTYANGDTVDAATYAPGCNDCHDFTQGNAVAQTTCLGCHGRQGAEIKLSSNPKLGPLFTDVHRTAGMVCTDCHTKKEMHGDGTAYESMLQPGATEASCENEGCHPTETLDDNPAHEKHLDDIYCSACHVKTVSSCYNCHFETEVLAHKKRFYGPPPLNGFVMLVNSEKLGKVTTASFQSLTYGDTTFYAIGPFNGHTISEEGRDCDECHNNANVQHYNETGEIVVTQWDETEGKLTNTKGVIPVVPDWQTAFKLDFVKFKGDPHDPLDPSVDPSKWEYLKTGADASQMLFATPLTEEQMQKLSLAVPGMETFEKSLHFTRKGKDFWYGADTSVTHAPAPGFETLTGVPNDPEHLGCNLCHSGTGLDANGDPYPSPYPGASCVDCHATKTEGAPVSEQACLNCHGRQKKVWMSLGYTDLHREGEHAMKCWDCHSLEDIHGDGTEYSSQLEPGAVDAACENCHTTEAGTLPDHSSYDPHGGKVSCEACHTKSVVSCYNCHFESKVVGHVKRAKQAIHDFVILVNRTKDGKVAPATFQSVEYQGKTWAAFAPFQGHTTMKEGRACTDCHANFGGEIEAIQQYNTTGQIKFATWNEADSTLSWLHGIVPLPADYEQTFRMDFITYDGDPADPVGPSKNWSSVGKDTWDGHQLFFASPLTKVQMAKLGFDTTATSVSMDGGHVPDGFALMQNYPNPFNPTTTIEFTLPKASRVTLKIFSLLGEEIETLLNDKKLPAGVHKLKFSAQDLSSGIYFYKLSTPDYEKTKKMIIIK